MSEYPFRYWMDGDDDGGGYDDGGGGDGSDDNQNDDQDQNEEEDDQQPDDPNQDPEDPDAGDQSSYDEAPIVDDDVFGSAEDYPNAGEEDFYTDEGNWTDDDYQVSAKNLFGDNQYFGDTLQTRMADQGYQEYKDPGTRQGFDNITPGLSNGLHLFERQGQLSAFGIVPMIALELLRSRFPSIDFNHVDVGIPGMGGGEKVPVQPLPPDLAAVQEKDAVDLRKYASPVGDQAQTSRCSAFAWTHAQEMTGRILTNESGRLSPNYTMYGFQQMQGDAHDYKYAYKGGDGTVSGADPGNVLVKQGTCRQEFWPDDRPEPIVSETQLKSDAGTHLLHGQPLPISIDDVRKVLSAGMPVHLSMNTGPAFADIGRDGIVNSAEPPSGQHGRHAMLCVGYTGNFFIIKNSWGTDWGENGYCYVPRKVLQESDPEFVAVILDRSPGQQAPLTPAQASARVSSRRAPVPEPPKKKGWWPF